MASTSSVLEFDDSAMEDSPHSTSEGHSETSRKPSISIDEQLYRPPLTKNDILRILKNPKSNGFTVLSLPVIKPPGGSVFVYEISGKDRKYDYRCDQLDPWHFVNTKELKIKSRIVLKRATWKKKLTDGSITDKFIRNAYELPGTSDANYFVLVEYIGDHTIHEGLPHGNSHEQKPFVRTCPSVLRSVELTASTIASKTYKKLVADPKIHDEMEAVLKPRDLKQIKNTQGRERLRKRFGQDSIYNAIEISYDLSEFVMDFKLLPYLSVVMCHAEIIQQINDILISNWDNLPPFVLHYDTTFNMGDFYVSALLFRHTYFKRRPAIPAFFLIHDVKTTDAHRELFRYVGKAIPKLLDKSARIPMVIDRELAIRAATTAEVPGVKLVFCWNHLKGNIKEWLREHGAKADDLKVYKKCLEDLLQQNTVDDYLRCKAEFAASWDPMFLEYFNNNLDEDIRLGAGKWILVELQLYNSISGVTNNPAEGFNTVMKRSNDWKELDIDKIILSLFYLTNYYIRELRRGKCGLGTYQLIDELASGADSSALETKDLINADPESILEMVGARLKEKSQSSAMDEPIAKATPAPSECVPSNTCYSRAMTAINQRRVINVPEMGNFNVKGTSGDIRTVSLFPKPICSCKAPRCYHILACELAISRNAEPPKKRVLKLNQLIQKNRPRGQKKSGKKGPPGEEIEFEPAPTSTAALKKLKCEDPLVDAEPRLSSPEKRRRSLSPLPALLSPQEIIDVEKLPIQVDIGTDDWIPQYFLTKFHRQTLLSTEWLGETLINAVQLHLKATYPDVEGLQVAVQDKYNSWSVPKSACVQILHQPGHWFCIGYLLPHFLEADKSECCVVRVFDSGRPLRISSDLVRMVAEYVKSPLKKLRVEIMDVQQQEDGNSCGPFAIAFAEALCRGINPCMLQFDPQEIRQHIADQLELPSFKPCFFDFRDCKNPIEPLLAREENLYCVCRNIDISDFGKRMIQCSLCSEWFHEGCVTGYLPKMNLPGKKWKCPNCL